MSHTAPFRPPPSGPGMATRILTAIRAARLGRALAAIKRGLAAEVTGQEDPVTAALIRSLRQGHGVTAQPNEHPGGCDEREHQGR